ncbi:MAG: C2H2-type zinc finger protein [Deltaproteobacteria bacterium]|nr:C2H2-type zinc finger protein [Deltaproteobacteria bacterium]
MQYFEVVLENGHMGAGNSYAAKRYLKGSDMISVISKVRSLPRIKKRHTIEAVNSIRPITREEYIKGKLVELKNPHLFRVWGGYRCPICGERFRDIFSFRRHVEKYGAHLLMQVK